MIKKYKEFIEEGLLRHYNRWHSGEQRKEDQHEYVDLGLPSGLLWAKCNVGADIETDYGNYYAWGETEEKNVHNKKNYKFNDDDDDLTKYNKEDKLIILEPEDDTVSVNWKNKWRMPTKEECDELIEHTTQEWIKNYNNSGINGMLITSEKNNNSIFFPAAGIKASDDHILKPNKIYAIWTSTRMEEIASASYVMTNNYNDDIITTNQFRTSGFSVRGVRENQNN